jgi:hypothetical protein
MVKKFLPFVILVCGVILFACGGGGGGGGGSKPGSLSVAITDARPALPDGVVQVFVTIDEVSVHQSAGGWTSLPMPQTPFTIDLLQFTDGRTTQLVPEVMLNPGKYTQVRLGVQSAIIVTDTGQHIPVEIPSGDLKTEQNFDFEVAKGVAAALTVDFDLSQSLVVTGAGDYSLKPVLHIVSAAEAATITGSIAAGTYMAQTQITLIVTQDSDNSGDLTPGDEEYTRLIVPKGVSDPTPFSIYWVVPNQSYIVEVQVAGVTVYTQAIPDTSLLPAVVYHLNSGIPI